MLVFSTPNLLGPAYGAQQVAPRSSDGLSLHLVRDLGECGVLTATVY